ncbi:hypothetical protein [Phaeocystidibacter luteus]|uniref:Uncharacterized protein n=1 Tax=Phaeocystidibacter luteus TaxID=911197 RepID=A0A6N6RIR4_9FLAO|nr:hypothetical protein [Phaeocystidibacter luteus]KAB2814230.1 hypothetical protein F8C67_00440 [Phaeocystidibacter luteus]
MAFLNGLKFSEVSDARTRGVISSKHLSLAILSGLGLAEICVGLLFSSIHLPGGDFSLLIGLVISTVMIVLILLFIDSPSPMRRLGLYRLLVGIVVGAAAYIYYFPFVG